jgi:hypothetical protein
MLARQALDHVNHSASYFVFVCVGYFPDRVC